LLPAATAAAFAAFFLSPVMMILLLLAQCCPHRVLVGAVSVAHAFRLPAPAGHGGELLLGDGCLPIPF
jgi:hypothetical protein